VVHFRVGVDDADDCRALEEGVAIHIGKPVGTKIWINTAGSDALIILPLRGQLPPPSAVAP
jgi:hypothetical protein